MDSASKRFEINVQPTMPTPTGTLWRQSLLNKVFRHATDENFLHSKTQVLNSGYHNTFESFIVLFNAVPLPDGRENGLGYKYDSSTSSRSAGKGKGKGGYYKGKLSLSKSSKKLSKRSIDSFMYRRTPVQVYDFYPIRPVHYIFPAHPPHSTPFTQEPSESKSPTPKPSIFPSSIQEPLSVLPSNAPSIQPFQGPSQTPSVISTCQWTACGDPFDAWCSGRSGSFLEPSNNVRFGGDPEGREIAVRCCSDTELPDFRGGNDGCPYADTEVNGECYRAVVYKEAVRLCTSIKARLCTKDELERRCTRGTGCNHDNYPIWSSTSGAPGYFDVGENSFKVIALTQDDKEIQETFSCREGITTDLGILKFDEDACSAECLFSIPYEEFENYCTGVPGGEFSFTIPGPFTADTQLYIGNVAASFDLECKEQLSISVN